MHQKTIIVGRLGAEPDMRYTPTGKAVTAFPVAVNRRWKDKGGETRESVTWFRVTAWEKLAELCNAHLSKGSLVLVEGEVKAAAWLDEKSGKPRARLELTAHTVRFLSRPEHDDDLPF